MVAVGIFTPLIGGEFQAISNIIPILYVIKTKIHSSCEIEYFVETHLCKLCVIYVLL